MPQRGSALEFVLLDARQGLPLNMEHLEHHENGEAVARRVLVIYQDVFVLHYVLRLWHLLNLLVQFVEVFVVAYAL